MTYFSDGSYVAIICLLSATFTECIAWPIYIYFRFVSI